MNRKRLLCALGLALAACNEERTPGACDGGLHGDAPSTADVSPGQDAGACAAARTVALVEGDNRLTGDTTGRTMDGLALYCGDAPSPWELLALEVPGSPGAQALLHFEVDGEATSYPIVLEWRPRGCDVRADSQCFPWDGMDPTTTPSGDVQVEAGSTVYLYASGRDEDAVGPWSIDVSVDPRVEPPVLTAATITRVGGSRYALTFDGSDSDADAYSVDVRFLDASGTTLRFTDPFSGVERESYAPHIDAIFLGPSFGGRAHIGEYLGEDAILAATSTAVEAELVLTDQRGLTSAPLRVTIADATLAALGESCGPTALCPSYQACRGGVCAAVAACDAIGPLTLTPGTTATRTVTLGAGLGDIDRPCAFSGGTEALFAIDVPPAVSPVVSYELRIDGPTDGRPIYRLADCAEPPAYGSPTCNYVGNTVPIEQGSHVVVVEHGWSSGEETVELHFTLVEVLEGGAACDPSGASNRCSLGTCLDGPSPVCPDTCDVFDVGACGAGRACEWQYMVPGTGGICVAAGTADIGEPCTFEPGVSTGCLDGLSCGGTCQPFCDAAHPCPSGPACFTVGPSPGTCFL